MSELLVPGQDKFDTAIDLLPLAGARYVHAKSGGVYQVLICTNTCSTDVNKFPPSVVYQNMDTGQVWSRPVGDFASRFTYLR